MLKLLFLATVTAATLAFSGCTSDSSSKSVQILENGKCDWAIVCGTNKNDRFAATELIDIFEKATKVRLPISSTNRFSHTFFVGEEFAKRTLKNEETSIFIDNGNLVLAGGGVYGAAYAVYDFCEKSFNYRLYGMYEGAETYKELTNLEWSGGEFSTRPQFTGYRINHGIPVPRTEIGKRYYRRNRCNLGDIPATTRPMYAQHGHALFVPPDDLDLMHFLKVKWKGMFKEHPEYFSLDRHGKRTKNGQLCFSNHDLRKLYISRFREVVSKLGKGIYMVGSNDSHNERYCWCKECAKLMDKYQTNGGPLYDFILELCENIRDLEGVYVTTLAYKGPEQTEKAPENVRFPANFVCDAAFLNGDRSVKNMQEITLENGKIYNHFENLKKWNEITDRLSWWYYGGSAPIQTYRRMQMELRELLEAGVDSVGACGTGGYMEFLDVGTYMFFQLLRDPAVDADKMVMDIFKHKYGAAADMIFTYLKELEEYSINNWNNPKFSFGCDDFYDKIQIEGKDLVRWQGYFDKAVAAVAGEDERIKRNVRIARIGVDCWSIVFASRIREADPTFKLDVNAILKRGYEACDEAEKADMISKEKNPARRALDSMRYYANLKTDALPPELSKYETQKVKLYLPEEPMPFWRKTRPLVKDAKAAAGVSMMCRPKDIKAPLFNVQLHDSQTKQWLPLKKIDASKLKPGEYTLLNVGIARLPRLACFVLSDCWGSSADMRNLGRFYDPSYHEKRYEFWVSVRIEGDQLLCDRVYLVDMGMPK